MSFCSTACAQHIVLILHMTQACQLPKPQAQSCRTTPTGTTPKAQLHEPPCESIWSTGQPGREALVRALHHLALA